MALYVLRRNPTGLVYDCNDGFVIRAGSEFRARMVASEHAADEGPEVWCDVSRSTCDILSEAGDEIVVMADFHAG